MKLLKVALLMSIFMLTSGCSIESQSPEQLIKDKDKMIYNKERQALYKGINQVIQNGNLILPSNSSEVGKINEVDLDGNGIKEIIAFNKKENKNEGFVEVGFTILKNTNGKYSDKSKYEYGDSIEYANFYDLDNDGNKEIIILSKSTGNESLYDLFIYSYKDNKITELYSSSPVWDDNKYLSFDVKMKINDIDNDGKKDIIFTHYNTMDRKAYISILDFDKSLKLKAYTEIDDVKSSSDLYITIGNVAPKKKGIIVDSLKSDNMYYTQVLILEVENKKLTKIFDENYMPKSYYIPPEDINNDKVIELPEVLNYNDSKNKSSTITWSKWNGKLGNDANLVFISERYYNYEYNFQLKIPNSLAKILNVKESMEGKDPVIKFSYYNENSELKDLFTINVISKKLIEESNNIPISNGMILDESIDYKFILYVNDIEEMKKLNLEAESFKEFFALIHKG